MHFKVEHITSINKCLLNDKKKIHKINIIYRTLKFSDVVVNYFFNCAPFHPLINNLKLVFLQNVQQICIFDKQY